MLHSMRRRIQKKREMKGQRKNKGESERGRDSSTNNHRSTPLILSVRKLNIDQSKQCETIEGGETEQKEGI